MNARPDPDPCLDPQGAAVALLLAERAGTVRPLGTSPSQLVRRAERARRRRRSAAVGAGLAATSVVAGFAMVTRPTGDDPRIDATAAPGPPGVAPGIPPSTDPARPMIDPSAPNVFRPAEVPVAPPATGAPLRLGLAAAGWAATSVGDFPSGDADHGSLPPMTRVDLIDADGATRIRVFVIFPDPSAAPLLDGSSGGFAPETVDLGDGRTAQRVRWPVAPPGQAAAPVYLDLVVGGASVTVSGAGASDEELIDVARAIEVSDDPAVRLGWIPADLSPDPTTPMAIGGGGLRTSMTYREADGDEISIGVTSRPSGSFADEVEAVRAAPTADTFLRTVRGRDAIVRITGRPGTSSVTWLEPSGNLVSALINTTPSGALEPDLTLLDHLVEVDEVTFQAMVTERPPG